MKKRFDLYLGIAIIALWVMIRKIFRATGEWTKRLGRLLASWGEDKTPRFSIELFHACYLADAEFHLGTAIYRGPMYGAYSDGDSLFFKLNWVARKTILGWKEEGGFCDFKLFGFSSPHKLNKGGDVCFMFEDGYAVLFLGEPRDKLPFMGTDETPRVYTYY